jgi:hypothetical protein
MPSCLLQLKALLVALIAIPRFANAIPDPLRIQLRVVSEGSFGSKLRTLTVSTKLKSLPTDYASRLRDHTIKWHDRDTVTTPISPHPKDAGNLAPTSSQRTATPSQLKSARLNRPSPPSNLQSSQFGSIRLSVNPTNCQPAL